MSRILRAGIAVLVAMGITTTPALAAFVPGCANPADSALNQYCDTIPAATGALTPRPGIPAVARDLRARVVHRLAQSQKRRELLLLPAPTYGGGAGSQATVASLTLPLWVILALAAATAALIGTAFAARRRRAGPSGRAPA